MLNALLKFGEPVRSSRPAVIPRKLPEGNALFEALVCEFHWTALQVGAVACCMSASLAFRRSWMLRSCCNLLPVEAAVVTAALEAWQDIDLPRGVASSIRRIYFNLVDARKMTQPLIEGAGVFTGPDIPFAKLEQIAVLWRKLAEDCADCVRELEPQTRWRLSGLYTGNALVLGRFLKDTVAGLHECVNHQGEVALPLLPQRRMAQRINVQMPCKIVIKGARSVGLIREASSDGLSLECDYDFKAKQPVEIEFRNGRTMRGVVAFCRNSRVDVLFDVALGARDPLIAR